MTDKEVHSQHLKPARFRNWLSLQEMANAVGRDKSTLRRLEAQDKIPRAQRYKVGDLEIRLWPRAQVAEIQTILKTIRPGRPKKNG